jgi:serine phosphatase RsbU (regulator of sigma subunit)/CHASE2 domain-containing sensor protein
MTVLLSTSDPRRTRRLAVWGVVALGALIGGLISLLTATPEQRGLSDAWQRLAPRTISTDRVAVVLIDRESLATVGPWPWPRYYLARLTEAITAQQPKVIGFDALFPEPDRLNPDQFVALYPELNTQTAAQIAALPSMDSAFATVLGSSPAVLGRLGINGGGRDPAALFVDPEIEGRLPHGAAHYPQVLASIPDLDDIALGHAMLNAGPDDDGIQRRMPVALMAGDRAMPGFAAELARIASDAPKQTWGGQVASIGDRRLPTDATGQLQLRFGRFPDAAAFSAARVLANAVPPHAFTGRVVIVGLAAEGIADIATTPLENRGYGVYVQAQAVDAILNHGWLSRPVSIVLGEVLAGLTLAVLVALSGTTRRRWPGWVAGALVLVLPLLSWVAFAGPGLVFDPVRPALIVLGATLALGGMLFVRARAERARLARELVEQRVNSAMQEGELQAARGIQLGMVPTQASLASLDPRLHASAVLEPARSVGGDFYDAVRIDVDRLLFVVGDVTGKGVPAALYMALSKTLAKSVLVRESGGLAHAVETLNRELLRDSDEEMGVTMLIALVNCATGEVAMVNAGHENPIVLRGTQAPETVPMRGGPPFCVCDFPYPEERVALSPGDTLVLITDGVTEAQDTQGNLFGLTGALAALAQRDAPSLAQSLFETVRRFEHPTEPSDDLTVLCLHYAGA